jgi:hypothetical protein
MAIALGVLLVGAGVLALAALAEKKAGASVGSSASSGSSSSGSSSTTNVPSGGGTVVGDVTWNQINAIGSQHGWTAAQIQDWANVIKSESNGTIGDTNPSSGAYGIAQFINGAGEYAQYGGDATSVVGQLTAMANYIKQRYQNPSSAWSFHVANNWY